jgi:prepilin-type N-terminal cleavage/methylation domain-containing protein/prepilin-type processing-associated H-X9-DG protein
MNRKAFTLIELLVVIAIIAILAAILFPVFAQAKLAAKKTSALSAIKQLGLGVYLYIGDSDDEFPSAFQGTDWTGNDLWEIRLQPYTKSLGVFGATADSQAGQVASVGSWAGVGVSFAANSYYGGWCCSPDWSSGFQLRGPMGVGDQKYPGGQDEGYGWLDGSDLNDSAITQASGTIMLAEKHGDDVAAWNSAYEGNSFNFRGNWSAFAMAGELGGPDLDGIGWGPELIPNGQATAYKTLTNNPLQFEYGVNGAVSATYSGQSNFVFVDGHAKSMVPSSTDPDPVNQPQNNLWDGLR